MRDGELFAFISERHAIYRRRENGLAAPWTNDPILRDYRFCNVYRELDAVTQWIDVHWRKPNRFDPHLWFAMAVARLFNQPSTLDELGYPEGRFPIDKWMARLANMKAAGHKVFNAAYIVSTNGRKMDKVQYVLEEILAPLWMTRNYLKPKGGEPLEDFYGRLVKMHGLGTFMAAQIVADMKYAPILRSAPDWWTFAASGPGSRRGLNRVVGRAIDTPWTEETWKKVLLDLKFVIDQRIQAAEMPKLHAQDLQNCLCEFDKYERARLGEGRPKQLYKGAK